MGGPEQRVCGRARESWWSDPDPRGSAKSAMCGLTCDDASRGPDPVPEPSLWLLACTVIARLLARSARPGGPSASDTSTSGTDCIVSTAASAQAAALVNDFADPLGSPPGGPFSHPTPAARRSSWSRADPLHPPPPRAGHPHAADHLGLTDIQRRDPLDDLGLVRLDLHPHRLRPLRFHPEAATRGSCRGTANLILVLEATRNGPQHSSRRPTMQRPRPTKEPRRRRVTAHHFQRETALPDRGSPGTVQVVAGIQTFRW
jgi:hypothetical protein